MSINACLRQPDIPAPGKGLEDLRKAYGEIGFINFTSAPDTQFDDENGLISLVIDVDEGKQFRIGSVKVLGLDDAGREEMLKTLPKRGETFNDRIWEKSLVSTETVSITFDFRPCSGK